MENERYYTQVLGEDNEWGRLNPHDDLESARRQRDEINKMGIYCKITIMSSPEPRRVWSINIDDQFRQNYAQMEEAGLLTK